MNILTSVCSSWHSWGFWSHTAGTYFWFCHANYISPAVPVKQGSSSSQHQNRVCGAQGQGKCGGKRENEPGIILCILPSTGLKSCFFFSSLIPGALSKLSSQAGQSWGSSTCAAAVCCSQVVRVKPRTLQARGRNAGNGVENLVGASLVFYREG